MGARSVESAIDLYLSAPDVSLLSGNGPKARYRRALRGRPPVSLQSISVRLFGREGHCPF